MSESCPKASDDCPWADRELGCHVSVHHEYWPKYKYRSELEKKFREHALNKVVICRREHDEIHNTQQPPVKPSAQEMRNVLNGNH